MHGRYTATLYDAGLPVLKSGVDSLRSMGVTAIRLGGSFTDADFYFWKRWIGKPWERLVLHTGPTFYGAQVHAFSSSYIFIYIFFWLTSAKLMTSSYYRPSLGAKWGDELISGWGPV